MKKILFLTVAGMLMSSAAHAATITVGGTTDVNGTSGSGWTTSFAGATVWDFESASPSDSVFSWTYGAGQVVTGTGGPGVYAAPGDGGTYEDYTKYLAVGPGSASVSLDKDYNYFGLYWGSMDATVWVTNTITFYNNGSVVKTYTADDVTSDPSGSWYDPDTNGYVNFYDLPAYDQVVFVSGGSNGHAFELDNVAVGNSPVPEPATMLLFGAGLVGLVGTARRRLGKCN
ncbi:MAG: hypothetical protein BWK76_10355 [Desulfobulbaceae bacterium A2]|nr:MAG: hypothetical protein BWK76_10355 [Desulfobulbaceae bacterium A2]